MNVWSCQSSSIATSQFYYKIPTNRTIFGFYHIGLFSAPLYVGGVPIYPGVSSLPSLLGILIFKFLHDLWVHGSPKAMSTLARGRARSKFLGENVLSMASFALILFSVRIFLERATAPVSGSRPSAFCLSAREALFHRRIFSTTSLNADTRESLSLRALFVFLFPK